MPERCKHRPAPRTPSLFAALRVPMFPLSRHCWACETEDRTAWTAGVEAKLRDAIEAVAAGRSIPWGASLAEVDAAYGPGELTEPVTVEYPFQTRPFDGAPLDEAAVNAPGLAEFDLLGMADKDPGETAQAVLADWPDDGYPPPPLDGTFTDLQRYAGIRVFADTLRLAEENELAMLYGLPVPDFVPRMAPADLWAQAERIMDEELQSRADLGPARTVWARHGQPGGPTDTEAADD